MEIDIEYCPFCLALAKRKVGVMLGRLLDQECEDCGTPMQGCSRHRYCGGMWCKNPPRLEKRKRDSEEDRLPPKKKKRTLESLHVTRSLFNTHTPPPLRVGVATWNVNHYGVRKWKRASTARKNLPAKYLELRAALANMTATTLYEWAVARTGNYDFAGEEDEILAGVKKYLKGRKVSARQKKLTEEERAYSFVDFCLARGDRVERAILRMKELFALCGLSPDETEPIPDSKKRTYEKQAGEFVYQFGEAKKCVTVLKGELKRRAVVRSIWRLFQRNPWLDVLLVQEVNSFSELTATLQEEGELLEIDGLDLGMISGPLMVSTGGKGQREFYPLVYRKSDRIAHQEGDWFLIDQDGKEWGPGDLEKGPESKAKNAPKTPKYPTYTWDKKAEKASFRGVVVYRLTIDGQEICFGSVHTTPGRVGKKKKSEDEEDLGLDEPVEDKLGQESDREFYRPNEFAQLERAFKRAAEDDSGAWWILGGDYYLQPESIVKNPETLYEKLDRSEELKGLIIAELKEKQEQYLKNLNRKFSFKELIVKSGRIDLVRNLLKDPPVTFDKVLPGKLGIAHAVSGTNWHDIDLLWKDEKVLGDDLDESEGRARYFATARIADLFVYTQEHLPGNVTGLFHPDKKGIVLADVEDHLPCSRFWSALSDHFPVGVYFSSNQDDSRLWRIVNVDNLEAVGAEQWLKRYRLAYRLAWLNRKFPDDMGFVAFGPSLWKEWLSALVESVGIRRDERTGKVTNNYEVYKLSSESKVPIWDDESSPFARAFAFGEMEAQVDSGITLWRLLRNRLIKLEKRLVAEERLAPTYSSAYEDFGAHAWGPEEFDDLEDDEEEDGNDEDSEGDEPDFL